MSRGSLLAAPNRMALRIALMALLVLAPRAAAAQESPTSLAMASEDPVGDLFRVPIELGFHNGGGLGDLTMLELDLAPVIPIRLTPGWNLISRTVVPFLSVPTIDGARNTGLGDIQEQLLFGPAGRTGFRWGIGPTFSLPTATLATVATGSWSAGPAATALWIGGPWVVGGLASVDWTFYDEGNAHDLGRLRLQPFASYNVGNGVAITFDPIFQAVWGRPTATQGTIPLGLGVTWTTYVSAQPMTFGAEYDYSVVHPDSGTPNTLLFTVAFLFPPRAPAAGAAVASARP
jgi:hypothetical protein